MSTQPHILIAEDEVLAALALESYLSREGFRVTIAHDGQQALACEARDPADALVTDLRMPNMGGRVLILHLRAVRPDLPVVVMTGYLSTESTDTLEDEVKGRIRVFAKPVNPAALVTTLRTFLSAGQP